MLALHAIWSAEGDGSLLVWAEDGQLPAALSPRKGRRPVRPRPRPHPFAAVPPVVAEAIGSSGSALAGVAARTCAPAEAVLWLPGTETTPEASSQLVREDPTATEISSPAPGSVAASRGLWPFTVPALRCPPGAALDVLLGLAGASTPGLHVGPSVTVLAAVAELALEIVAGGRVLPDLAVDPAGRHLARWLPLGGGADAERAQLLAQALPPVCRALQPAGKPLQPAAEPLQPDGADPGAVVGQALAALVDAVCRESLRRPIAPAARRPRAAADRPARRLTAVEAWLQALSTPPHEAPVVVAEAGELSKLERLVAEWRAGAAGTGGPWRLCFRLREPAGEPDGDTAGQPGPELVPDGEAPDPSAWRVDLLLQASDDLSLVVEAAEVWRSGESLRRATRTLDAPHEVLLAELGRALRAFPELAAVLEQTAPTALETDLAGAHRFLAEVAPALEVAGFGVLLPSWWRRPAARLGLHLKASSRSAGASSGFLTQDRLGEFDWQAAIGDQEIGLAELRRLAQLKQPLVRVRGQWTELRPDEIDKLVTFLADRQAGRAGSARTPSAPMTLADLLRFAAGDAPAEAGVPVVAVEADGLVGAILRGDVEDAVRVRPTPAGFNGELRAYQQRGVAWIELLERLGLGACLADDMGLGKTATVLAVVQAERAAPTERAKRTRSKPEPRPGPTLVVCPTSVVGNWQREAERFTPRLKVLVHHGAARPRGDDLARRVEETGADLVVTSYPLVERDKAALGAVAWGRIVLDEAQHVKNPAAKQTRAVRALTAARPAEPAARPAEPAARPAETAAPRRLALTGTPVENHLGELWSIMEILNPGFLGTETAFREKFAVPIERYREEDAAAKLRTLTRPFVLRRLKTDRTIITDLPDKMEMKVVCSLTREQATLYQAVVDEMLRRIEETEGIERKGLVLATMLRLKQVCNHPAQFLADGSALGGRSGKLERTVEIAEQVQEAGEKALVFTQFAEMGAMLQQHLQHRLGAHVPFLHGGVPRRRRDEMVTGFQDPATETPAMVLSLKAGGTGLNLTAANHVVHFDRWWNPAVEDQATDRAFRIGQRRDVQVRKLVCAGTVEDKIDQMIEAKKDLADRIVGSGEGWITELSTEELADVFSLSRDLVTL